VYLTYFDKHQEWLFTPKQGKISQKHLSGHQNFWLNWKITFNNKYRNCVILYSQLIQYMHSTRFHLITVSSDCPWNHTSQQMHKTSSTSHRHVWSRTVANFQKSRGATKWSDRQVHLQLNTLRCLRVARQRYTGLWWADVGAVTALIRTFCIVLQLETPLRFVQAFCIRPLHYTVHTVRIV